MMGIERKTEGTWVFQEVFFRRSTRRASSDFSLEVVDWNLEDLKNLPKEGQGRSRWLRTLRI